MRITRSAILEPEVEIQLAKQMQILLDAGRSANYIAEQLQFGILGTPYSKLKKRHVWSYRSKFNKGVGDKGEYVHLEPFFGKFPPKIGCGGIKEGAKHYKNKIKKQMSFKEFKEKLNSKIPHVEYDGEWFSKYVLRKRAYLILLFWTCLRKSELYERLRSNFIIDSEYLEISLQRKKKFYRKETDVEPFYLPLEMPMVNEVVKWIQTKEPNELVFDFGSDTAWRYPKEVFGENYYPHFFRASWITRAIDNTKNPEMLIKKLLEETGLSIETVVKYIIRNPKHRASISKEFLETLKIKGDV